MSENTKVLVVDDESAIRMLWRRFLKQWGFEADEAENGQVGLEKAADGDYVLVITDLTMPVMTGNEMVPLIKEKKPDQEIVVVTGYGTLEVAVEMMKFGASDFLTKPINFEHAELVIKKLVEKVANRQETTRLRQENKDLEELNDIKEKFMAITNHELRTPVSIINNIVDLMQKGATGERLERMVSMLTRSSGQLMEIVDQMHELSQLNSPAVILKKEDFPLEQTCLEVAEEFGLALEKRSHELEVVVVSDMNWNADRLKFKKVIRELLQNAIKFTPDGGRLRIKIEKDADSRLLVEVNDNGIGISEQNKEKIFDLFYEVRSPMHHHTSKEAFLGGGMGLGLSIVNEIVVAHGGEIKVISEPDQGAQFQVFFPG